MSTARISPIAGRYYRGVFSITDGKTNPYGEERFATLNLSDGAGGPRSLYLDLRQDGALLYPCELFGDKSRFERDINEPSPDDPVDGDVGSVIFDEGAGGVRRWGEPDREEPPPAINPKRPILALLFNQDESGLKSWSERARYVAGPIADTNGMATLRFVPVVISARGPPPSRDGSKPKPKPTDEIFVSVELVDGRIERVLSVRFVLDGREQARLGRGIGIRRNQSGRRVAQQTQESAYKKVEEAKRTSAVDWLRNLFTQ